MTVADMRVFGIRPALWPTVITLPAVVLALTLGTWQIQRYLWKRDVNAERTARAKMAAIAPPVKFDPTRDDFRRIRVRGTFDHTKEFYQPALSRRGNIGSNVLTPLKLADGTTLIVNRGWVPRARKAPATRPAGQIKGMVTIEGLIRVGGRKGWLQPDNQARTNIWYYIDPPAMARAARLVRVRPYFVAAGAAPNPGGYPKGGQTRVTVDNDHLPFVITWYMMVIVMLVIYFLHHRRLARIASGGTKDS